MTCCMRCGEEFNPHKSAYVLLIRRFKWGWGTEAVTPGGVPLGAPAVHLNGDRECVRTLAGYRQKIAKVLDVGKLSACPGLKEL